jgi:hypothetical protein
MTQGRRRGDSSLAQSYQRRRHERWSRGPSDLEGMRPRRACRNVEQGSAQRGAGSPESGRGVPGVFGDLTSQAIVGGDPLRLTRVASPNQIGTPAPPRQPPRLRDATVEPIVGASSNADPMRVSGVRSPRGPSSALRRAPVSGDATKEGTPKRGAGTAGEWKRGPEVLIRGSDLEGGRGRRAVPPRLISGRIPKKSWGPCSTSTAAPLAGATAEACKAADTVQ